MNSEKALKTESGLSLYHPIVSFGYFVAVIAGTLLFIHPFFVMVSLLCGITLAAATFGKMMTLDRWIMGADVIGVSVALTVSLALLATVICAKLIGAILPVLAVKCKLDPAVMASPFITTVVDAISLLLYFFIAKSVLHI